LTTVKISALLKYLKKSKNKKYIEGKNKSNPKRRGLIFLALPVKKSNKPFIGIFDRNPLYKEEKVSTSAFWT
jgi:hypothetical protein